MSYALTVGTATPKPRTIRSPAARNHGVAKAWSTAVPSATGIAAARLASQANTGGLQVLAAPRLALRYARFVIS